MLNFAVGPVMMGQSTLNIGLEQIPYFRTENFSAVMKQNERLFKSFLNAPENARAVFMTGSGTDCQRRLVRSKILRNMLCV